MSREELQGCVLQRIGLEEIWNILVARKIPETLQHGRMKYLQITA